jgi:hypothetical protein
MPVTYKKIASVTVGSGGAANIEFTSIPGTYTDLVIKISGRTTATGTPWTNIQMEFNGSGGTAYSGRLLFGDGSAAASASVSSEANARLQYASNAGATASTFGNSEVYIPNIAGSTNKSISADSVTENNATQSFTGLGASLWANTAAITSIKLTPSSGTFVQYSTAVLYGISKS